SAPRGAMGHKTAVLVLAVAVIGLSSRDASAGCDTTTTTVPPVCGDHVCQGGETCLGCPADCGICGLPTLPLALGECHFAAHCCPLGCMPTLSGVPSDVDDTGWTGFFSGADVGTVGGFVPAPCGGGVATPLLHVGDVITSSNGQVASLLAAVQCLLSLGQRDFLVPVVSCDGSLPPVTVTGFAEIAVADGVASAPTAG